MSSFEFHITDLATATACRCPPDRPATVWRTDPSDVTDRPSMVLGGVLHARLVEHEAPCPFAPEEHVGRDIEVVRQRQVLVDDLDAQPGRVRAVDGDRLALEAHLPPSKG